MSSTEILLTYIKKLGHPLKEIRERALKLLIAKLELGWELEDELAGTRLLLEALLAWFHVEQPTYQKEALNLLLTVIKTQAGTYIAREIGIKELYTNLCNMRDKIQPEALEILDDVRDTLCFRHTVESQDDVTVPRLNIPSATNSECEDQVYGVPDPAPSVYRSSGSSSESNFCRGLIKSQLLKREESIKLYLFPWADIGASDAKTILLIEDALKLLKSTRRCCRFIRDVFLRDFPAEVFLNRPSIVQSLLSIVETNRGKLSEPLQVLLCITRALRSRLRQICSLDLIHQHEKPKTQGNEQDGDDEIDMELEAIVSDARLATNFRSKDDGLQALRQLPAPQYALDALHVLLTAMSRSLVLVDGDLEFLDQNELNISTSLVQCLVRLLLDCVSESFWSADHTTKTHRDIAHRSIMVMRLFGDLLNKYSISFTENTTQRHHRIASLRLLPTAESLLRWCRLAPLPPKTLVTSLQGALLDPAMELYYPEIATRLAESVQTAKLPTSKEYNNKYQELKHLFAAMEDAACFMKNKDSCCESKSVLRYIKNSLPVLELHLSDSYLMDVSNILLRKLYKWDLNDSEWGEARSIALSLMAHNSEWVRCKFYTMLADMVKSVFSEDIEDHKEREKCLILMCDVGILTEICCHGLSASTKTGDVEISSSEIMLYFLRGRMALSESCWWRLLASLLPAFPLLHVYAAHDTDLGQAISKSLEWDIAECMGVSSAEVMSGLTRLLFVRCPSIQMDAAHSLCHLLDVDKYLPPSESLRADVLTSALKKVQICDFNVDFSRSTTKATQTSGLIQMLDVLKQDLTLNEEGHGLVDPSGHMEPTLEPSLRKATLQQLSVLMTQHDMHETFLQCDGIRIVVVTLRISLMADDFLAFPECAISCVSVLNSICYGTRHTLAKIVDLPALLLRVILIFPTNESTVQLAAQILAVLAWAGFTLQELDKERNRVLALPASVVHRITLPFPVHTYWNTSSNAVHTSIEWLQTDEEWRRAIRVRWSLVWSGPRILRDVISLGDVTSSQRNPTFPLCDVPGPLSLRVTRHDATCLNAACPLYASGKCLMELQNATSHGQVVNALALLASYTHLVSESTTEVTEFASLPWHTTLSRFLSAPPASPRDTLLLTTFLKFIVDYMDNVPKEGGTLDWIKTSFINSESSMIGLLSREQLYPQQSLQDSIEVTQLHIHIVKVLLRCVLLMEIEKDYDSGKAESLLKILLACLEKIDLKNFHLLGYLNELLLCIRYLVNSPLCNLSEETSLQCLEQMTATLVGCGGRGCKGQGCRLYILLTMLAVMRALQHDDIPLQRWSGTWEGEAVAAVASCVGAGSETLRASALAVMATLAQYTALLPHLTEAVPTPSISQYAAEIFSRQSEASIVRARAASLLTSLSSRISNHSEVHEKDLLCHLKENNFMERCLEILVKFCKNEIDYAMFVEPNVPTCLLERRSELEVRASKNELEFTPSNPMLPSPPPTADLVVALADVVHNVVGYDKCPVQAWNDQGVFRMLFRCTYWTHGTSSDNIAVRTSTCRTLARVTDGHKCVRVALANTRDCLHNLLASLTPFSDDNCYEQYMDAQAQALFLLSTILKERVASNSVWQETRERLHATFFLLLLQCLEMDGHEVQDAGLYCITQLTQSLSNKKHSELSRNDWIQFLDNLKSPYYDESPQSRERLCGGDVLDNDDCLPEYLTEEMCKELMLLYQKYTIDKKKFQAASDGNWTQVCSCLSSLFSISARARAYAVHREFPKILLVTLQGVRDHLSMHGKTADVIKNADSNPLLLSLYWLLTTIGCLMTSCPSAKEGFASHGLASSLLRLWLWCMMTTPLRVVVMDLLLVFTNECPVGCSAMSSCVGGRSLIGEVCTLALRESALLSRPRPSPLLPAALNVLRHCMSNHSCRAVVLKNGVLECMHRIRGAERTHYQSTMSSFTALAESLARYPDGAAELLKLRTAMTSRLKAALLPAIAHAANHHRNVFLHAPDLMELLTGSLLAGDISEIICAARAIWALGANNHRNKLALRSYGATSAVSTTMERLQRSKRDAAADRALQLLKYVNTVLNTN